MNCTKFLVVPFVVLTFVSGAFSQQASLSPSTLSFSPQVVNLVSPGSSSQTVTLTNTGNADLMVTSVEASGAYKQTNNCSTVLPHASCAIEVIFAPGTIGSINGAITINDNAPLTPQVVSLSGKAVAPARLFPGIVDFGTVAVGTTSAARTLTLTAAAGSSLSIKQIAVSGNFAQTNNCPSDLQPGQSCAIHVVFHPTENAAVEGALAVSVSTGNTAFPFSAALAGTGSGNVMSQVSVEPAVINFGNKGPDLVDTVREVTVSNTSRNTSLTIQSVSLAGSPNAVGAFPIYKINSNSCAGMLKPEAQCKIEIAFSTVFSQLFPESYPAALSITDSDPTSPQVVGISANQVKQLTFSPASVAFPVQAVGTTTTRTVNVTGNDLQGGLLLDTVTSGDFAASGDLSPCLTTPGGKCTLMISFTPSQTGLIKGSVTLETYPECNPFPLHHCSDPIVLNVSGIGQ